MEDALATLLFRELNEEEEKEFRQWVHNNMVEMAEAVKTGRSSVFHPVVRDEWEKIQKAG